MPSRFRIVALLGVVLVLAGVAGFGTGSYLEASNDCVSGTVLDVDPVEENGTSDLDGNTTAFEDLSPDEQRVFLEAYTDDGDGSGWSDTYANWSQSWFDGMGAFDSAPRYVRYRGGYYETTIGHVDCGLSAGPFVRIAGILGLALGWILLGTAGVWHLRDPSD